ncbi:MAG: pyruvate kinase [Candidatus Micrarchaeia archaeon]
MKNTKIVATLGPASIDKISELSKFVDVFRINLSHGTKESQTEYFNKVRDNAPDCAILMDLPGPKLRLGKIEDLPVKKGDLLTFGKGKDMLPVTDDIFFKLAEKNMEMLIADGKLRLLIEEAGSDYVTAKALNDFVISSGKGINLPDAKMPDALTENDYILLDMALQLGTDFVGLSFVSRSQDIKKVKDIVNGRAKIISKIEKSEAMKNIRDIAKESDGLMVARGDLGIELGLHKLYSAQKEIIDAARSFGKPVILATEVLNSMVAGNSPTRAEVIDIFNGVKEGVDAIMLSNETAVGVNPIEAAQYLRMLADNADLQLSPDKISTDSVHPIAYAAAAIAESLPGSEIMAERNIAMEISKLRVKSKIIATVNNIKERRELNLWYSIYPELSSANQQNPFVSKKILVKENYIEIK